ncbi:16S rRNA (uracil(1498)-N(3))-methyltransferase [Leucobacter sp. NPDC058333]|uniref:16S rRNA (uracil(1498)-N(3))-methyltransferase n=1 Tax=Leucobacter sp. NPDC058333 TaxID=3346450 RepID=UPI00364EB4C4
MAHLYYREDLAGSSFEPGSLVEIIGDEARHAVRVSRLRVGERTKVGNGAGVLGEGTVEDVAKDRFSVRVERLLHGAQAERGGRETLPRLTLVQALAKGDRDERAVEQATEFGVDAIAPWQATRSVSRWDGAGGGEKTAKGLAKWRRIAREAAKQSMRASIPEVREPLTLGALRELAANDDHAVILLHPRGTQTLASWAAEAAAAAEAAEGASSPHRPTDVYLVVGPEGGFADEELATLESAGAAVLVLGSTVLRTSSAGPAALAVLNVAFGRW